MSVLFPLILAVLAQSPATLTTRVVNLKEVYRKGFQDGTSGLDQIQESGSRVFAFAASEAASGVDLDGDGELEDTVLHSYALESGTTNLGLTGPVHPRLALDHWLAFARREGAFGDLNGDGDALHLVLHVLDASTGVVQNVGLALGSTVSSAGFQARTRPDQGHVGSPSGSLIPIEHESSEPDTGPRRTVGLSLRLCARPPRAARELLPIPERGVASTARPPERTGLPATPPEIARQATDAHPRRRRRSIVLPWVRGVPSRP